MQTCATPTVRRTDGARAIRVVLLVEHPVFGATVQQFFSDYAEIDVSDLYDAVDDAFLDEARTSDVVLLDIGWPVGSGLDTLRAITRSVPDVRVLAISSLATPAYRRVALQAGASVVLSKDMLGSTLIPAVRALVPRRP